VKRAAATTDWRSAHEWTVPVSVTVPPFTSTRDPAHLPLAVPLERLRGPLEALRGSNIRSISCLRAVIRVHGFKLRLLTPSGLGVLAPATR
jgi:hypothetical protein